MCVCVCTSLVSSGETRNMREGAAQSSVCVVYSFNSVY